MSTVFTQWPRTLVLWKDLLVGVVMVWSRSGILQHKARFGTTRRTRISSRGYAGRRTGSCFLALPIRRSNCLIHITPPPKLPLLLHISARALSPVLHTTGTNPFSPHHLLRSRSTTFHDLPQHPLRPFTGPPALTRLHQSPSIKPKPQSLRRLRSTAPSFFMIFALRLLYLNWS